MRFKLVAAFLFAFAASVSVGATDTLALTAQLSNLAVMRTEYVQKSPAFTHETRQRALDYIGRLESSECALTTEQFLLACFTVSAFAINGHDTTDTLPGSWFPSQRLPMRLWWQDDGVVVARVVPIHAHLATVRLRVRRSS